MQKKMKRIKEENQRKVFEIYILLIIEEVKPAKKPRERSRSKSVKKHKKREESPIKK